MQLHAHKIRQSAHDHALCQRYEMHVVCYMLYDQVDAILGVSWEDFVATWGYHGAIFGYGAILGYGRAILGATLGGLGGTWAHHWVSGLDAPV